MHGVEGGVWVWEGRKCEGVMSAGCVGGGWEVGGGLGGVWWHTMLEAGGQTCRSASSPIAAGMASSTQEASARLVVCCVCVWPL